MPERWLMIEFYLNYAVSTLGRVRNLNTGKLLKHQSSKRGGNYAFINLSKNGRRVNRNVHILVARAFIGDCPSGKLVHHKDTNRMNPKLENLEYITHKVNCNKRRRRIMAVRIDLDEPDLKTIIRGLTVLLLEIEKSPDVVQAMLKDNKRYVNSLKEKMERYLEGEKALKERP